MNSVNYIFQEFKTDIETYKNTFLTEHLRAALSVLNSLRRWQSFAQCSLNITFVFSDNVILQFYYQTVKALTFRWKNETKVHVNAQIRKIHFNTHITGFLIYSGILLFYFSIHDVYIYFVCTIFLYWKICFGSYRYAGYKQYTWWIHDELGKGVRKVISFCTISAIRNFFLSNNQEYFPFIESNDDRRLYLSVEGT